VESVTKDVTEAVMAKMFVSKFPRPTQDDDDCAHLALVRARKAKRALKPYKDWCELILQAQTFNELARRDFANSPRLAEHNRLLNELRRSGELDRMKKARAFAPGFFRKLRISEYHSSNG
jgi:hypothetical protein